MNYFCGSPTGFNNGENKKLNFVCMSTNISERNPLLINKQNTKKPIIYFKEFNYYQPNKEKGKKSGYYSGKFIDQMIILKKTKIKIQCVIGYEDVIPQKIVLSYIEYFIGGILTNDIKNELKNIKTCNYIGEYIEFLKELLKITSKEKKIEEIKKQIKKTEECNNMKIQIDKIAKFFINIKVSDNNEPSILEITKKYKNESEIKSLLYFLKKRVEINEKMKKEEEDEEYERKQLELNYLKEKEKKLNEMEIEFYKKEEEKYKKE